MDEVALLEDESGFWRRLFRRRTSNSTSRIKRKRAPPPAPMPIIAVAVMGLAYYQNHVLRNTHDWGCEVVQFRPEESNEYPELQVHVVSPGPANSQT